MAQFEIALKKTLSWEGGYSNNPLDKGGETYCGISRKAWPLWSGWAVIDGAIENGVDVKTYAHQNALFMGVHVAPFYLDNFWQPIRAAEIESQEIANYLFDFAVNSGIDDAVKALQWAINKVTMEGLKVDGVLGAKTLAAIPPHSIHEFSQSDVIRAEMKAYRLHHILKNVASGNIHLSFAKGLGERALA